MGALGMPVFTFSKVFTQQGSDRLSPWQEGFLDIHHINTGAGDSTFFVFPDGTTMLLDAGALVRERPDATGRKLPAATRLAGMDGTGGVRSDSRSIRR